MLQVYFFPTGVLGCLPLVEIIQPPEQEVEKRLPGFPAKEIAIGVEHLRLFIERRKEEEKIVKPKEKVTHSIVSSVV